MKQKDKSIFFVISLLFLSITFSGSALAEIGIHINGFHLGFEGHGHHYRPNHGYNHNYPRYNAHNHSRHSRHITYGNHYSNYRRPCHKVSKIDYDGYGVPHRIAGTMCYDQYGVGYIVAGSRYHLN
jgi:hypothetical protein